MVVTINRTGPHRARTRPEMTDYLAKDNIEGPLETKWTRR